MSATAQLKQLSNLDHLLQFSADDLLEAFVGRYNDQNQTIDDLTTDVNRLTTQRDGYKRQATEQTKEIEALTEENTFCRKMAKEAEGIANKSLGLQQELAQAKQQIIELRKQVKELNGEGNAKKLKEQVKRLKEKNTELKNRNAALEQKGKTQASTLAERGKQLNQAINKIDELQKQLAHDTGSGLYHNKDDHLIIWPQKTKMQDSQGNTFEGRSLLYLHQSGRGGLMTYNPDTEEVNLCAAPRGGLRPSEDLKTFATNWLYKVNALQDGIVKEEDMIPVNYNGNFEG